MSGKRIAAGLLCVLMLLALLPQAVFAAANVTVEKIEGMATGAYKNTQKYYFSVEVELNNSGDTAAIIAEVVPKGDLTSAEGGTGETIAAGATKTITVYCEISQSAIDGRYAGAFDINLDSVSSLPVRFDIYKSTEPQRTTGDDFQGNNPEPTPAPTDGPIILVLSPNGKDGRPVVAPSGNYGDTVQLRVPIFNRGKRNSGNNASEIRVRPVLSADLNSFPFVIDSVDYTKDLKNLKPGETEEAIYHLRLSKEVESGVKEVKFVCEYYNQKTKTYEKTEFSVFVTVVKGKPKEEEVKPIDKDSVISKPKVIIEAYTITPAAVQEGDDPNRLFAGEPFALMMRIKNTSADEAVKNMQISLSSDAGVILPTSGGSNSLYIARIAPNEVEERIVQLQTGPDAEPKTHMLSVKFAYESAKTELTDEVTETIAVPVSQRIRVRLEDPILQPDGYMDQANYVNLRMFNMGKSTLYNCMIEVEGEGLRLEESQYHGSVSGGGTLYADFGVIPTASGELEGKIVVLFEDAYGVQNRIEKPIMMNVADMNGGMEGDPGMMPGMIPGMEGMEGMPGMEGGNGEGLPLWAWVAIGGGALILLVVVITGVRRRKRRKELTEAA